MKKTMLFCGFYLLVATTFSQGLLQPNYQQYLGNSINLSGISLLGEQPYFGIGKKQLLENLPPALSSGALVNYAPALRKSSPFGVVYPSAYLMRNYNGFATGLDVNGSYFGEWDATGQFVYDNSYSNLQNNLIVHYAQNNAKIDRNGDNFLDLPLSKRLFLMERTHIESQDWEATLGVYYLRKKEESGHLDFEENEEAYAFGNDMNHLGASLQARTDLINSEPQKKQQLLAEIDANLHEREDYYGDNLYQGNQRNLQAMVGYLLTKNNLPNLFFGAKLDYGILKENFGDFRQERREESIGLLARHQQHWNQHILTEANLELEHHNLQKASARPSLRVNFLFPEQKKFFLNLFTAYDWRYPNLFTDYSRIFVSDYDINIEETELNNWQPNQLWQFGTAASYHHKKTRIKLQYHYFHFCQKTLWDLYQTPNATNIYSSNERAFRHLLEVRGLQRLGSKFTVGLTYRWDQNKSTYGEEFRLDPFLSEHSVYTTFSYYNEGLRTDLRYHLHSPQQLIGLETTQSLWLHRLDFKATYDLYYAVSQDALQPFSFTFGIDNLLANQQQIIFQNDANGFNGMNLWGITHGTRFYLGVAYDLRLD